MTKSFILCTAWLKRLAIMMAKEGSLCYFSTKTPHCTEINVIWLEVTAVA